MISLSYLLLFQIDLYHFRSKNCFSVLVVNNIFAGDRTVEWQADSRVSDSPGDIRDNVQSDCWLSLTQF